MELVWFGDTKELCMFNKCIDGFRRFPFAIVCMFLMLIRRSIGL